jgi:ArsR family transcriptional regulator
MAGRFRLVSDRFRVRLLLALSREDHRAEELADIVGLKSAAVSYHLSHLRAAGLLEMRRDGLFVFYGLTEEGRKMLEAIVRLIDGKR